MAHEALQAENAEATTGDSMAEQARWLRNVSEKLAVVYLASGGDDDRGGVRESSVEDPRATPPGLTPGRKICENLSELINSLPAPESHLIRTIYFEGATLQEAANRIGISKSWASRMHAKVLEQLARSLRKLGAD